MGVVFSKISFRRVLPQHLDQLSTTLLAVFSFFFFFITQGVHRGSLSFRVVKLAILTYKQRYIIRPKRNPFVAIPNLI